MGISQIQGKGVHRRLIGGGLVLMAIVATASAQAAAEPTGELRFEGTHIARLWLVREDGHPEEWENLSGTIEIPVGTYQIRQLTLDDSYACQTDSLAALGPIKIDSNEPAVLKAGGPLQQAVTVARQGRILVLSYSLRGIGNEQYTPRTEAGAKLTVYRGDEAIATGRFEYG